MRALMVQGAGSNVGKSTLVAGLCRAFARRGFKVAPFKPQNMSNNAAATPEGGEIGRAQALQARAAGIAPHTDMNPVLLKPETDVGSQVVVQGRRLTTVRAAEYARLKPTLLPAAVESFRRLAERADLVLIEGAGSPAEINLRAGDIANMGFAEAIDAPVVLVGDIDRGGVIAQLVGTQAVLEPADAARIKAFLVNKFRGDPRLFDAGRDAVVERTGWPCLGVLPWFDGARALPAEDSLDLAERPSLGGGGGGVKIAWLGLSRVANFDDLDPLALEPSVDLVRVGPGEAIPGDVDLVVVPGAKSTRGDLDFLRAQGWDVDLAAHLRRGGRIFGICGGYQMLGREIRDPLGVEGPAGASSGLGLLDVVTEMTPDKAVRPVSGRWADGGAPLTGYEIHIGRTDGPDRRRPAIELRDGDAWRTDGAVSADGRVMGAYVHGCLTGDAARAAFLARIGAPSIVGYDDAVETTLDALADHLETHLDVDALLATAAAIKA